jgi:TIR domain/Domain of unknown function (DUF4062)
MGAIPGFEVDVVISYAHIDNRPHSEGLRGWVDTFRHRLRIQLTQLLGEEVSVWYDHQLGPNPIFRPEILSKISNSAIFLSIVSPRYCKSPWCQDELNAFCKSAQERNLPIGNNSRIFKVVKTYVPIKEHPVTLQDQLAYEFYDLDENDRQREFRPDIGPSSDLRYWEKLEDVAWNLKQLIDTIRAADQPRPPSHGKAIYLAESTFDLSEQRGRIKRELQQYGHTILPDRQLPLVSDSFRDSVREYLSRSDLSVHLIGKRYGVIPEGESKSTVHLQSELAAERNNGFQQIIWMPTELQAQDEAQQRLIDSLWHGLHGHRRVELLQTKLEDLKTFIQQKITGEPERTAGSNFVYLICDRQDLDAARTLEDYLDNLGIKVILPATEGEETEILEDHKLNLLDCDSVLIYYGRANEIWLRMKQRELQKLAGYGRTRPLLAKCIFISAPRTDAKERLRDHEAVMIKSYERLSPECLTPFLARMRQARGAHR